MPTYIIKPSRDEDFYVWWSTVVDAPIGWGPRDYVPLDNEGSPERFARADERGTSANWPDWPIEKMPFGWNVSEWRITNQDDLEETGEGWWLLPRKNLREFCRRRDAGEQIADLVKWEPYEWTGCRDERRRVDRPRPMQRLRAWRRVTTCGRRSGCRDWRTTSE